jgi:hypothetical protein
MPVGKPGSTLSIVGQTFGRWTVLRQAHPEETRMRYIRWVCQCTCGTIRPVLHVSLVYGKSTTCGCSLIGHIAKVGRDNAKQEAGKRYGCLTVIQRVSTSSAKAMWLCRCDCGAGRVISGSHLRQSAGKRFTCGVNGKHLWEIAEFVVLDGYRRSASRKGNSCDLSDAEWSALIHAPCYYCGGSDVNNRTYRSIQFRYNGVDRIDSSLGYVHGNVVPCCKPCNYAKNCLAQEEFFKLVSLIARRHPEKMLAV